MNAATRHVVPLDRGDRQQVVDVRERRHRSNGRPVAPPPPAASPPLDESLLLALISTRVAEVAVLVQALGQLPPAQRSLAHLPSAGLSPARVDHAGTTGPADRADQAGRALPELLGRLSDRELEVLRLMAQGLSNSAVAARLHVSERTVEATTAHVFRKLELEASPQVNRRVLAVLLLLGVG